MTLIKLTNGEKLVGLERVQEPSDEEGDEEDSEMGETDASADDSAGTTDIEE